MQILSHHFIDRSIIPLHDRVRSIPEQHHRSTLHGFGLVEVFGTVRGRG